MKNGHSHGSLWTAIFLGGIVLTGGIFLAMGSRAQIVTGDVDLYCDSPSSPLVNNVNCADPGTGVGLYCPSLHAQQINTSMVQCTGSAFGFGFVWNEIDTKTTFTSSSFTSYFTCSAGCYFGNLAFGYVYCQAFAQFSHSSITATLDFRINDPVHSNSGASWRMNDPVAGKNQTLSYMTKILWFSDSTFQLQFATSASTLTVWHGGLFCVQSGSFIIGVA